MADSPAGTPAKLTRRAFIKVGALAGGGLLIGTYLRFGPSVAEAEEVSAGATGFSPNAFIRIGPDGTVSLIAPNTEMGQGAKTALPMILAEELDVAWEQVEIAQGDFNPAYGRQFAVGSSSTPGNYTPLREAGAAARAMLVSAAAKKWGVPASECSTADGAVLHKASGRRAGYGELTVLAASLAPPETVILKDPKDFKLIGRPLHGVDNRKIVTGQPLFGMDYKFPGMVYATYTKCPVFGGKVGSANVDHVKSRPGVRDAFVVDGIEGLPSGVAIIADSTWSAFSASKALRVQWDEGPVARRNSAEMADQAGQLGRAAQPPPLPSGVKAVSAAYHYPFLAHATMEPQNCTAVFKDGVMEMWVPTQIPGRGHAMVTRGLGLAGDKVVIHVTRLGGGFGRRGSNEFALEAAAIARRIEGTHVQLIWTREQDQAHDNYRSNGWHWFHGGIDASGRLVSLHDSFVKMQGGPGDMTEDEFPFPAVREAKVVSSKLDPGIPTGYWRAPGSNGNTWATQCFVDELAHAAGRDPLDFTLGLLDAMPEPERSGRRGRGLDPAKMRTVLTRAAEKAGWGTRRPRGQGQGLAVCFANGAHVAIVANVTVTQSGGLTIDKLTAVVDAGIIINRSSAESQVQGSVIDGISAAWLQRLSIEHGSAKELNFDTYPLLRIDRSPRAIDVEFVESLEPPTGLGEPALPPAAPAVCNAIFAATGKRIRTLPFEGENLTWS